MAYKIELKKSAAKELRKLEPAAYTRIRASINKLASNPRPAQSVKIGGSKNLWWLKTGVYRVVYEIQDKKLVVFIIKIGHRKEVYRKR